MEIQVILHKMSCQMLDRLDSFNNLSGSTVERLRYIHKMTVIPSFEMTDLQIKCYRNVAKLLLRYFRSEALDQ